MQTVRFDVRVPQCPNCERFIASNLKHSVISRVDVRRSYNGATIECQYDEKKHSTVDRGKLERELKELVKKLGYAC
jgi:hypothetical protein